jgi:hypothetical protein
MPPGPGFFHHEALLEFVAELLGRDAGGDVGDAGGGERQDEADRTVGKSSCSNRSDLHCQRCAFLHFGDKSFFPEVSKRGAR